MKKKYILLLVVLLSTLILALATSYALFTYNVTKNSNFKMVIGSLELTISDTNTEDKIIMENIVPTEDSVAISQDGYTFSISNTGTLDSYYTVYLDDIYLEESLERLDNNYVKINFTNKTKNSTITRKLSDYESTDRAIDSGIIKAGESITYELKMWVDYAAGNEAQNKYFATQIRVVGTQENANSYVESVLNGADPVLTDSLVPVIISEDGTVKKADINSKWYDYNNQQWANVVILVDDNVTYENGDIIPESNIESYFVWIPKYSYKIFNLGNYDSLTSVTNAEQTIDVKFGLNNTSDSNVGECTTPMTSGASGNCQIGDYMTHPAFISMDANGLWVGKYETGYKGATSASAARVNSNDSSKIIIKPNTYSWRDIQPANAFTASYNYLRSADSHMMKNTEWGAVAYLQHSKYGSQASVRINNNSSNLTGYSAVDEPTIGYTGFQCTESVTENCNVFGTDPSITQPYNTETGYLASTTGNITGVYDMSGGAHEHMMGVIADTNGNPLSGRSKTYNSGFKGNYGCPTCESNTELTNTAGIDFPDEKYYDLYIYGTSNQAFNNRILGDATGEIGPFGITKAGNYTRSTSSWYNDNSYFSYSGYPWFDRGGSWYNGSDAGMFRFGGLHGLSDTNYSFRVVLAP